MLTEKNKTNRETQEETDRQKQAETDRDGHRQPEMDIDSQRKTESDTDRDRLFIEANITIEIVSNTKFVSTDVKTYISYLQQWGQHQDWNNN